MPASELARPWGPAPPSCEDRPAAVRAGLLRSARGKGGGLSLSRPRSGSGCVRSSGRWTARCCWRDVWSMAAVATWLAALPSVGPGAGQARPGAQRRPAFVLRQGGCQVKRKIVEIDRSRCDGCGLCVPTAPRGRFGSSAARRFWPAKPTATGWAPAWDHCPHDAIRIVERRRRTSTGRGGAATRREGRRACRDQVNTGKSPWLPGQLMRFAARPAAGDSVDAAPSQLGQWPIQLPPGTGGGAVLQGRRPADRASCVPFAHADFHGRFWPASPWPSPAPSWTGPSLTWRS